VHARTEVSDPPDPPDQDPSAPAHDSHGVLALRARQEEQVDRHQRLVERVTHTLGRPRTIYLTLLVIVVWITWNVMAPALSLTVLDPPPFYYMQGTIALAALLMTTMVLTTQNRQARHAEQRAHLDLEVNILAEKKIAKLIALIEELRRDMPNVHDRRDSIAESMTHALDTKAVISALEETMGPAGIKDGDEGAKPSADKEGSSARATQG
jgi:uncharacterized membrane protein